MLCASRIKGANELRSVIVSGLTCWVFTAGPGICFTPHYTKLYPRSFLCVAAPAGERWHFWRSTLHIKCLQFKMHVWFSQVRDFPWTISYSCLHNAHKRGRQEHQSTVQQFLKSGVERIKDCPSWIVQLSHHSFHFSQYNNINLPIWKSEAL